MPPRRRWTARGLQRFQGSIAAAGFASGDQVVVGAWRRSPLGRVLDVMWVRPDGERVLLAPSPAVRDHVADLYTFERTEVVPTSVHRDGPSLRVAAGPLVLELTPGPADVRSWLLALRPGWLRRSPAWIEVEDRLVAPLGGPLLGGAQGVHLAGRAPGGQREWYGVADYRTLVDGSLRIEGDDAGGLRNLGPGLGVGLSDFPAVPALVAVDTLIEPHDGGRSER
jgi:hypothetical protein